MKETTWMKRPISSMEVEASEFTKTIHTETTS